MSNMPHTHATIAPARDHGNQAAVNVQLVNINEIITAVTYSTGSGYLVGDVAME